MVEFLLNNKPTSFKGDLSTPLLWYLRDHAKLTGTKFGCGIGSCGACTVHLENRAVRACSVPMSAVDSKHIVTIEALAENDQKLHPVQQAWVELDVPQCGYCQAGQIMAVADFLNRFPAPSDQDIDQNLSNLCRCGTYTRLRQAIHRAAELMNTKGGGV